ncbi:MAG: electron transfer flavoprotein subunit alpha/FixB family protein [Thermodesulfobacteriota bacterium]
MKTFVYIEPSEEGIDSLTRQIVSGIRKIPLELRGPLKGISIGKHLEGKDSEIRGIFDELIRIDVPLDKVYNLEVLSKVLTEVVRGEGPALLFLGFTHQGMELGPAVGWRLGVPVATNCVEFNWTGEKTAAIKRPIQGGKFFIGVDVNVERGAVISIQKGAWKEETRAEAGEVPLTINSLSWKEVWAPENTEVLGIIEERLEGEEDITKAEVLVSVGRGLGDPENLPVMKELAEKLGGMISCSRPVVDLGWLPGSRQVGISGKSVAPVVYLALGISGQSNHLAGMDASRIIIAVNKDPSAPIFGVAHYGVVDNILEFVPELLEQIKKQGASSQ